MYVMYLVVYVCVCDVPDADAVAADGQQQLHHRDLPAHGPAGRLAQV